MNHDHFWRFLPKTNKIRNFKAPHSKVLHIKFQFPAAEVATQNTLLWIEGEAKEDSKFRIFSDQSPHFEITDQNKIV